ncbi:MAG: sugar phosphate isomerase/epimerase [Bryobacterales bacterium]|nr:sugar phosphate isomerase/epimerase [Bryobacterales bacterium]
MPLGVTRRDALAGLAASGAWLYGAPRSKMRFGFTTYQWGSDWAIPELIANCIRAQALGVELRTSSKYAHGVELPLPAAQRREVRKRFADSPVTLVGMASGERFDWPDPARLQAAVENTKGYLKLSQEVGGSGVRVFPNDFHPEVPREKTIEQIARALNQVGKYAAGLGQMVRLENHGSAGRLETLRAILDRVDQPSVRVKLNGDARDSEGGAFERNFRLVENRLADTLHMHDLNDTRFPYPLQMDLLVRAGWEGWWLLEESTQVPDRVQALIRQREIWEGLLARSLQRRS